MSVPNLSSLAALEVTEKFDLIFYSGWVGGWPWPGGWVGGWLDKVELMLTSALVWVEVELSWVEAELGNYIVNTPPYLCQVAGGAKTAVRGTLCCKIDVEISLIWDKVRSLHINSLQSYFAFLCVDNMSHSTVVTGVSVLIVINPTQLHLTFALRNLCVNQTRFSTDPDGPLVSN